MLGPDEALSSKWELPPIVTASGEHLGLRSRPNRGRIDPAGWHPGMPYGAEAWESYRRSPSRN
jgi:hypothetical protein